MSISAQVVEEGWPQSGVGSEIMAIATEEAFDFLDAAPERITGAEVCPGCPPPPPTPPGRSMECYGRPAHPSWLGQGFPCCGLRVPPHSAGPLARLCGGLHAITLHPCRRGAWCLHAAQLSIACRRSTAQCLYETWCHATHCNSTPCSPLHCLFPMSENPPHAEMLADRRSQLLR